MQIKGIILNLIIPTVNLLLVIPLLIMCIKDHKKRNMDTLTNLYNELCFFKKIRKIQVSGKLDNYIYVTLDIDGFKTINGLYGLNVGDYILKHIGESIQKMLYEGEIASRTIGDIFSILIKKESIDLVEERLQELVNDIKSSTVNGVILKPSIGVYYIEGKYDDILNIGTKSSIAKQEVKGKNYNNIAYYDERRDVEKLIEQKLLYEFPKALREKEFLVYYQVKYDLEQSKPIGAEALVRWNHEDRGLLYPDSFINLFEVKGCIKDLDLYVFRRVCENIKEWELKYKEKLKDFRVSVNLSVQSFLSKGIVLELQNILDETGIDTDRLEIEITESFFYEGKDKEKVVEIIRELRQLGFVVAMDDFGTGYSSLNALREVDIDILKIDRVFLGGTDKGEKSTLLVKNVIRLAKEIGLKTVAEGVETESQVEFLRYLGCNIAQGYYFSKPITREGFEETFLNK